MRSLRFFAAPVALALLVSSAVGAHAASGGTTRLDITAGSLSVSGAAPGNFTVNLIGADQLAYTTLGGYTPQDDTGTGAGYNVTFQATPFSCTGGTGSCPSAGDTFAANSLIMAPPTIAAHTGTSGTGRAVAPAVSISTNTAIDTGAGAVKVLSAALNTGMGTYDATAGTVTGSTGSGALQLAVPSTAYNAFYTSVLTVSIVAGP